MKRNDHLLWIAAEECAEVAQRLSKAARFGLQEVQPGQPHTNAERIVAEWLDLNAAMNMLFNEGLLPTPTAWDHNQHVIAKVAKVKTFLDYSRQCGTLDDEAAAGAARNG